MSDNKSLFPRFALVDWAVRNQITVSVLTVIITISGFLAYRAMPAESFPEVVQPTIFIGTPYPGNSPVDMERLVTRPLEKQLNTISGVDKIKSTSVQGFSSIEVRFDFKVGVDEALRKVKDKVDAVQSSADFPKDLPADPNIFELNIAELQPIMNINLSGEFTADQLEDYATYLEEKIEDIPSIASVDLRGVDDKEVEIAVDLQKMENLDISFNGISDAIKYENMSVSGGDLLVDGYRRNIRVLGEFESMQDIENIIVKQEKGAIVYLRDIAKVQFTNVDRESYAREFKNPVVSLDVKKRSGENLIKVSASINEVIAEARESYFPKNLALSVTNDQSNRTKNQVGELENSIIFGIILVVLVLTFFLGLRNALFVGIAIPLSMLLSFLILNSLGVTLNFMVLFGLVLALGMLVDNGVVIVENIYRFRTLGYSAKEASMLGSGEVAMPIISSTATTLAAFLPLALWPGLIGEFMKYLPLTLIVVLGSSLFVALVVNPALASRYMKLEADVVNRPKWTKIGAGLAVVGLVLNLALGFTTLGNLLFWPGFLTLIYLWGIEPLTNKFMAGGLPRLERWYEGNVQKILSKNNAAKTLLATVGLFVLSFILMAIIPPKVVFFPDNQPNLANIYIEMPVGTDIEETNRITKEMEDQIEGLLKVYEYPVEGKPYNYMVESVIAQVGKGTSDPNEGPANQATPHKAKIVVAFREMKYRLDAEGSRVASADVLNLLRDNISTIPGVLIAVEKDQNGPPQGAPINIELSGDDYEELLVAAEGLRKTLVNSRIKGYDELKIDVTGDKPELPIIVDRAKARTLGVSTGQIGDALRTALFGKEISRYKEGESDYPINIRFDDRFRFNLESLMNQKITFRDQSSGRIKQVPISAIATPSKTATFSAVKRNDLNRVITLYSGIEEGANANLIIAEMQQLLKNYELPKGVTLNYTGQQEEQAKELGFLSGALLIAVFLIFLIIVGQFNSARIPFLILTTVILSLIGVLLGLLIFRMDFVIIMTMIGIISLSGVVVNNAIVLADYGTQLINRRKAELGLDENVPLPEAELAPVLSEAGRTRLRPVLLTAITTILGLIPLATGMNLDFFSLITNNDPMIYFGGDTVAFWGPISWTVIFGLTFATFLTLVIMPVMLLLTERSRSSRYYRKAA
ncbi:MAG: efflux RND transporter permease subunit [Schleiferiaceae bacterium]|nr:efflux RND transporter permease subunit [Schleiferiaceae bacterium]